jgi:hypothetical protein
LDVIHRLVAALHSIWLALVFGLPLTLAFADNEQGKTPVRAEEEQSVRRFLQTLTKDKTTRYIVVFRDLNGDGRDEAIVHFISGSACGNAGCNTLVLSRSREKWRTVTTIRITRPGIRVLRATSLGWRDLAVWVQDGGIGPGYYAQLRFDGKTYPSNPSMPPAIRIPQDKEAIPAGVVIDGGEEPTLLYGVRE